MISKHPKGEVYGNAKKIKSHYNKLGGEYEKQGDYNLAHYYYQYAEHWLRASNFSN